MTYTVLPLIDISTHALTWSATNGNNREISITKFQLTHSRGVRPAPVAAGFYGMEFQLTHSRGVRLFSPLCV